MTVVLTHRFKLLSFFTLIVHNTVTQIQFLFNIALPPDLYTWQQLLSCYKQWCGDRALRLDSGMYCYAGLPVSSLAAAEPQPVLIFAYPRMDGSGWVDLGAWCCAEVVYQSKDGTHPGTNQARRRVTTLIKSRVLPLCHTDIATNTPT